MPERQAFRICLLKGSAAILQLGCLCELVIAIVALTPQSLCTTHDKVACTQERGLADRLTVCFWLC